MSYIIKRKMPLPKPCSQCGKTFQPKTKHSKICPKCHRPGGWNAKRTKSKASETEMQMNYHTYKDLAKERSETITKMLRAMIKAVPRDTLIDSLKANGIIKRGWVDVKKTHLERKSGEKL